MLVSLDYYRILGVPLQADSAMIEQAYHDRLVQLPHQNYSSCAIASRQLLLQQAYDVLKNEEIRIEYDKQLFDVNEQIEANLDIIVETTIEIEDNLFLGALLILLDLGDYELVLSLSEPYLNRENTLDKLAEKVEDIPTIWQDLVLTVVLTYLELAKEQWQDKEYNLASNCLESAEILLDKDGVAFKEIKQQIKQDLGKIKPYQVLELLNRNVEDKLSRQKAVNLILEMLESRGGIENRKVDKFGLNIDNFLKFIQQIRVYLTAEEQQKLFESEAKRPSPAALYLESYALIGMGFSYRQPELIMKAKQNLMALTIHQDVYLEQSICALLLGQTAEAEFSLSQSQEKETIDYIKEKSGDSPDLLPGLCIYTEKWLGEEVFSQFKDLQGKNSSLDNYFTDDDVQKYLEKISPPLTFSAEDFNINSEDWELKESRVNLSVTESIMEDKNVLEMDNDSSQVKVNNNGNISQNITSTENHQEAVKANQGVSLLVKDYEEDKEDLIGFGDFLDAEMEEDTTADLSSENKTDSSVKISLKNPDKENFFTSFFFNKNNLIISIIILFILSAIASSAVRMLLGEGRKELLEIPLNEEIIEIPPPETEGIKKNLKNTLDIKDGEEIINKWLKAKENATGADYNFSELNKILTPNLIGLWIATGNDLRKKNAFRRYEHQIKVESVEINPQNMTEGIIKANVMEKSQYYQNGVLIPNLSYEEKLLVRYDLIKEEDQWLINKVTVLD